MKRYFQSSVSALAMSALVMSSAVVATVGITAAPAFSQSSNANVNSRNDNRNERSNQNNRSNNGRGSTASSLGALNAAHANAMALENAADNSRVGMIAIYKTAVQLTVDAKNALDLYNEECIDPASKLGVTVEVEIDGGGTVVVPYCDNLLSDAAKAAGEESFDPESYLDYLEVSISAARTFENSALLAAANKSTDNEIIEALWSMLDIDGYELPEVTE